MSRRDDVARHEAGHCVIAVLYGAIVTEVSIIPNGEYDGYCKDEGGLFRAPDLERVLLNHAIQVCLAGPAAQKRFHRRAYRWIEGSVDYRRALGLCHYIAPGRRRAREYLKAQEQETVRLVERYWSDIERVAAALLQHDVLDRKAVDGLLNHLAGDLTDHSDEDRADAARWERAMAETDPHIWSQ